MKSKFLLIFIFVVSISLLINTTVYAEFAEKEVRLIVAAPAGGQSDTQARLVAQAITELELISQPVIVTNIVGAAGRDALREVLKSNPDGHIILLQHTMLLTQQAIGVLPTNYTELTMLGQIAEAPMVLVVKADSPWDSFEDLIADAKARPNQITAGINTLGDNSHFIMESLIQEKNLEFKRIVFQGGAPARTALLGGHLDMRFSSLVETIPYVNSGDFKILAVTANERLEQIPDIPTLKELGLDISFYIRTVIWGPPGMSESIVKEYEEILKKVVDSEQYRSVMLSNYTQPIFRDHEKIAELYAQDFLHLKKVAEKMDL